MNKKLLISVFILILVFVMGLTTPTLVWPNPGIDVDPVEYDFGDVELGSSSTTIVTISNTGYGYLYINSISINVGSSDFYITSAPSLPVIIRPPDGGVVNSIEVEITYAPSALGYASAVLAISWVNGETGVEHVSLGGVGVGTEPSPSDIIADILEFIDSSVADETLAGTGPGRSAERRLNALKNMIEAAGDLIEDGLIEEACQQLMDAYRKTDGLPLPESPPDFVMGVAAPALAVMIQNLRISLGCE